MSLRTLAIEWKQLKSFATEKALLKRLDQESLDWPEHDDRCVIVRTPEGRWTAIVSLDMTKGGYVGRYAFLKI